MNNGRDIYNKDVNSNDKINSEQSILLVNCDEPIIRNRKHYETCKTLKSLHISNNCIDGYVYKAHKWQCLLKINGYC